MKFSLSSSQLDSTAVLGFWFFSECVFVLGSAFSCLAFFIASRRNQRKTSVPFFTAVITFTKNAASQKRDLSAFEFILTCFNSPPFAQFFNFLSASDSTLHIPLNIVWFLTSSLPSLYQFQRIQQIKSNFHHIKERKPNLFVTSLAFRTFVPFFLHLGVDFAGPAPQLLQFAIASSLLSHLPSLCSCCCLPSFIYLSFLI